MSELSEERLTSAILEIRDLLRLIAEPAMAERDGRLRDSLRSIAGTSAPKAKAIMLMDGTRTQLDIHNSIRIHQGQLSTLVKQLSGAKLLGENPKKPALVISLPVNFFEDGQ